MSRIRELAKRTIPGYGIYRWASERKGRRVGQPTTPTTAAPKVTRSPRRLITLVSVVVIVVAVVVLTTNGGKKTPSGPFKGSAAKLRAATTAAVDDAANSPGLAKPPTANCIASNGTVGCFVRYTIKEPAGINFGDKTILPTTGVFKYAFSDPKAQEVSVTVSGPATSVGGLRSTSRLFSLLCFRSDAKQIDWDNVTVAGLEKICTFSQFVNNP